MERYKKQLKIETIFSLIVCAVAAALVVLSATQIIQPLAEGTIWQDFWNGFISGVSAAVAALSLLGIIKNIRALRDEKKLRARYIKAHDERTLEIWKQSAANSYWFYTMGLLLAAVVAGYFSHIAFFCILGCLLYFCLLRLILKVYYTKKL